MQFVCMYICYCVFMLQFPITLLVKDSELHTVSLAFYFDCSTLICIRLSAEAS